MVILVNHSVPTDGIHHTEQNVTLSIENTDFGDGNVGTLYITESSVVWLNSSDQGILLQYKQICLHAISRDLQAFPQEHLLLHYEGKLPGLGSSNNGLSPNEEDENDGDEESECGVTEIRFSPQNKESLEPMFEALANCQTLHPDSDCQLSDDDFEDAEEDGGGDGFFNTEDGIAQLNEEGRANLERFNQMLQGGRGDAEISARTNQLHITNGHAEGDDPPMDSDQFQDAEDMNE